jgi:hypothetical protein
MKFFTKIIPNKNFENVKNTFFVQLNTSRGTEPFTIQDEEQFKTKIMADGAAPTIVDFSATWCGP